MTDDGDSKVSQTFPRAFRFMVGRNVESRILVYLTRLIGKLLKAIRIILLAFSANYFQTKPPEG